MRETDREEVGMEASARRIAVVGLAALAIAMGVGRFAFTPLLPMMQDDAGLSMADGAWLASANYFGYLVGAASAVALRVRARTAVRAGLLGIGLATLAMGLTRDVAAWLVLRGLAGVGTAWVFVFASSWSLGRLGAAGRPGLSGVVFAGVGAGIAAAGSLCLLFMQLHAGSAGAWQGLGLMALGVTAVIWRTVGDGEVEGDRASRPPSATGFRWTVDSARLVLVYGTLGFGYIIPATFVPAMGRQLVRDPLIFGSSWPIFGLAAAASPLLLAGFPMRVLGNQGLWTMSQLLMAVGVAAPVVWPDVAGVMVAALLVGGTFMVSTMAGMREGRARGGAHATRLMAMMTTAFAIGQILGPLLVAHAVGPDTDFVWPLSMAALLLVVSAVGLPPAPRP